MQVDLIEQMGPLPFNLEFFTECQDMRQLLAYLDAPPDTRDAISGYDGDGDGDGDGHDDGGAGSERRSGQHRDCGGSGSDSGGVSEIGRTSGARCPQEGGGDDDDGNGDADADAEASRRGYGSDEREERGSADEHSGGGGGGDIGRRRRGRNERFHKMTEEICDVVDSYGLVCFYPLNIQVRL